MFNVNFLNKAEVVSFLKAWLPVVYSIANIGFENLEKYGIYIFPVEECELKEAGGQCIAYASGYYITYRKDMDINSAWNVILHEVIHAMIGYPAVEYLQGSRTDFPVKMENLMYDFFVNELIAYSLQRAATSMDSMEECIKYACEKIMVPLYAPIVGREEFIKTLLNS